MSGTTTYTVVKPSSSEELRAVLVHAAASGSSVSFEATSMLEELNESGPRTFTVKVDTLQFRPIELFEVTDENTRGAFRIRIPSTGPVEFTIYG